MTQIAEYRKAGTIEAMPEYDFARVDKASICDDIVADSQLMITIVKALAVALIFISTTSLFFVGTGVFSIATPSGAWALAEISAMLLIAGFAPICFLSNTLQSLIVLKDHCVNQISLAENRKVELLNYTPSK